MNISNVFGFLSVLVALGLLFSGSLSQDQMREVFGKTTYYILWIVFLVWIVQFGIYLKSINFSFIEFISESWPVLIFAAILTVMIAISNPPKLRVLSDETNLASVSRSMLENKNVFNYVIGKNFFFTFTPIESEIEKRPMLFPFVVHLFHQVRGYSVKNLFALNLSLHFALLASVGILVRRAFKSMDSWGSDRVWIAAVILVLQSPILTLAATSGGFDLFSACFLGWTLIVMSHFIKQQTQECFAFLWINLLLLAHARYESFIYSVIIITGLLCYRRLHRDLFARFSYVYLLTALAMVPLIFQRILSRGKYENPPGVDVFSTKHFLLNCRHFLEAISDTTFFYPYPGLLLWFSLLLIPFLAIALKRNRFLRNNVELRHVAFIVLCCLCAYIVTVLSYYMGDPQHPTSARFFVMPVVVMSLLPVIAHGVWPHIFKQRLLIAGSVGLFMLYGPVASGDRFTQSLELIRETEHARSYIESLKDRNLFIIADRPGIYTAFKYGAADFDYANKHKGELLAELRNNLYREIIVLQQVQYDNNNPFPMQMLDPEYILNPPLAEYQITGDYYLRISNIKKAAGTEREK
jgi:hypothetical protein